MRWWRHLHESYATWPRCDAVSPVATTTIYVQLLGVHPPLWRVAAARQLDDSVFELLGPIPDGETWQFQPGQLVECDEDVLTLGGYGLFARRAAAPGRPSNP